MTPTFNPIAPWPLIAGFAALIVGLTLWAYRLRLRGTSGRWRWFALGLRMAAVVVCLLAALRPSVLFLSKAKVQASILFLLDVSSSMGIGDEARQGTRFEVARKVEKEAVKVAKSLGQNVVVLTKRFDKSVLDDPIDEPREPKGQQTALGSAVEEAAKSMTGTKPIALVLLCDGASNTGKNPLQAAQALRNQQVPIVAVGLGTETAGPNSMDIAVRDVAAGPIVYEKRELEVTGTLAVRGFAGKTLDVDLLVDGQTIASKQVKVPAQGASLLPVRDLKWTPQAKGEARLTMRVKKQDGELLTANNDYSTFVTVLKGGISVLYLQGQSSTWESRFLTRALDADPKIQVDLKRYDQPPGPELDADFKPGAYDVYILGDLPASFLSQGQKHALAEAVTKGSGLIMIGGNASFGSGGWANTEVADILPVKIHPGDGQSEPPDGLKAMPNLLGLDSFVLKLGPTRADTQRLWNALPPIPGANRFSGVKEAATLWATAPDGEPLMAALNSVGKGRSIAFGGETWIWARAGIAAGASDELRLAHLKFWRQAILWLAHKEDEGESQVRLALDRRRVAQGGRVELTVVARDKKGEPIPGVQFETTVTRDAKDATPEKVDLFNQGGESRAPFFPTGAAGDYRVTVTGKKDGQTIGSDSARFIVYQDDRELENPAADHGLLKEMAQITSGKFLRPEQLADFLKTLDKDVVADSVVQKEVRVWDNWPFLLIFATLLTLEWYLRKRHGWV